MCCAAVLVLTGETDEAMAAQSDIKADIVVGAVRDLPALVE